MKKLDNFVKNTEKLREMILEHPDTPIAILVDPEVCGDDCGLWYAPDIRFSTGEILNCEQDIDDEKVFTDRNDFEETLVDIMADDPEYEELSDEEFDVVLKGKLKEYEPFWTKVIKITATT